MVHLTYLKPTLIYYYYLNSRLCLNFTSFSTNVFFLFQDSHCIYSSGIVLVRILQRSRTSNRYIDIYKRRCIIRKGSRDYRGLEIPWSAICKLDNQESQWRCDSVLFQRPENGRLMVQDLVWVRRSNNQEHQCLRAGECDCFQFKERENSPFLLFVLFSH